MKKYQVKDTFFEKAKAEGYRARSVYKLEGIQKRYKIIKKGDHVLDLGAAPGSFLQLISKLIGPKGHALGIDLKEIDDLELNNIKTEVGDIFDLENLEKKFDVITSDLAPATTGIKSVDAGRSFQLNNQVLEIARKNLKNGGHVILKCFPGQDHDRLIKRLKIEYKKTASYKPEAVRQTSREIYLVGLGKINHQSLAG